MESPVKITDLDERLINRSAYAEKLGISISYVSKLILGHRKSPKYEKRIIDLYLNQPIKRQAV